jgi:hypothetical protein
MFSIELKCKKFMKKISVCNDSRNKVFFEGFLGDIEELNFIEGGMLEIKGLNGTLRIDLSEKEIQAILVREAN